ncbi:MAG: LURP-one-related family protein [Xylanivirga thermophila]|uniref:LURP-one-related/scramblase family protein n=1 Tax=Xylanivirga thermophila TaxID=2496273 RepID=UPI00101D0009|nr:LURP-one-related family protein [Xylanivirga thermophila]
MRFIVRQKIFALGDDFTIKDDHGNDCFLVRGQVFSFGNKLRMYDMSGRELIYIEQELFHLLPQYNIYYIGNPMAKVKKEFTFFRPSFSIFSDVGNYSIEGDFFCMDFSVLKDGRQVAKVSKKWLSWSDTYGVAIMDKENYAFILALVIVIDQVLHDNNASNNGQN